MEQCVCVCVCVCLCFINFFFKSCCDKLPNNVLSGSASRSSMCSHLSVHHICPVGLLFVCLSLICLLSLVVALFFFLFLLHPSPFSSPLIVSSLRLGRVLGLRGVRVSWVGRLHRFTTTCNTSYLHYKTVINW